MASFSSGLSLPPLGFFFACRVVKPKVTQQMASGYYYLFGAVEPTTGDGFLLELPALNTETFQVFMDAFGQQYPRTTNIMIMDRGGFHMARDLVIPGNVTFIFLPPTRPNSIPSSATGSISRIKSHGGRSRTCSSSRITSPG